ncbi:MAG: hypothetical protein ACTSYA_01380 [Candidatus Kariarchaeaceae archaeon]
MANMSYSELYPEVIPETADPVKREAYASTLTEDDVKNAIIDNVVRSITVPMEDKVGLLLETVKEKYFIHKRLAVLKSYGQIDPPTYESLIKDLSSTHS